MFGFLFNGVSIFTISKANHLVSLQMKYLKMFIIDSELNKIIIQSNKWSFN